MSEEHFKSGEVNCVNCEVTLWEQYYTIRENFFVYRFFSRPDGKDNCFCSKDCIVEYFDTEIIIMEE